MMKIMLMILENISVVVSNRLCTGCGTCTAFCPKEAISMNIDFDKGIFLPELNENMCDGCGMCYNVCPGHEVDFNNLNMEIFSKKPDDQVMGNFIQCFVGYSTDKDIRFNSSSGGLITQILISALDEGIIDGALVTRMSKEDPLKPEPFIARNRQELVEASQSKYCPVPANVALKKILDAPKNEKFAVVGLPCHIHGIRKAETVNKKLKNKIKLHLGIICNHVPTFHATDFMFEKLDVDQKNVVKLNYRGEGWPGGMKIALKDGEEIFIPQFSIDYWGEIFNSFFYPSRCTVCTDKSCQLSDISFADAWTKEIMETDSKGTSLIIVRKDNGFNLDTMKNDSSNPIKKNSLKNVSKDMLLKSQQLDNVKRKKLAIIKIKKLFKQKIPIYGEDEITIKPKDYILALNFLFKNYLSNLKVTVQVYAILYEKTFKLKSKIIN